jgi:hypothetical protein
MSFPIIKKKIEQENTQKYRSISEQIQKVLIQNEANALDAELILTQMAHTYATVAKKNYLIKQPDVRP